MTRAFVPTAPDLKRMLVRAMASTDAGIGTDPCRQVPLQAAAPELLAALYRLTDIVLYAARANVVLRADHPAVSFAVKTLSQVSP